MTELTVGVLEVCVVRGVGCHPCAGAFSLEEVIVDSVLGTSASSSMELEDVGVLAVALLLLVWSESDGESALCDAVVTVLLVTVEAP